MHYIHTAVRRIARIFIIFASCCVDTQMSCIPVLLIVADVFKMRFLVVSKQSVAEKCKFTSAVPVLGVLEWS